MQILNWLCEIDDREWNELRLIVLICVNINNLFLSVHQIYILDVAIVA